MTFDSYLEEGIAAGKKRVDAIAKLYASGIPLYTRAQLEYLDQHLRLGSETVTLLGFDGLEHVYSLNPRKFPWAQDRDFIAKIGYESYQALTVYDPAYPERLLSLRNAINISYTEKTSKSQYTAAEIQSEFSTYEKEWLKSTPCTTLRKELTSSVVSLGIHKIVAFALGSLRCGEYASRSHTQHAALLTMASSIEKATGQIVQCFVQDPAYNEIDQQFLSSIGVTTLDDPHGFLHIDANTLVFSVCPNIPVKQITADMPWPVMMIWDTVETVEELKEWRTEEFGDGDVCRVSPYGTDPDSSRVREMVQHYDHITFIDRDDNFTPLTMYVRKPPVVTEIGRGFDSTSRLVEVKELAIG